MTGVYELFSRRGYGYLPCVRWKVRGKAERDGLETTKTPWYGFEKRSIFKVEVALQSTYITCISASSYVPNHEKKKKKTNAGGPSS